eukprot:SAG25_NODE_1551_length_2782_cov_2.498693_3_plen_42_part_00
MTTSQEEEEAAVAAAGRRRGGPEMVAYACHFLFGNEDLVRI